MKNQMLTLKEELQAHGLKATHQRIAVLKILSSTDAHPSAEMIMKTLEEEGVHMSFATVYNVLETFVQSGLIIKLTDENDVMRFDYNTKFHVHVFSQDDGSIKDFFDDDFCRKTEEFIRENLSGYGDVVKINLLVQTKNAQA